MLSVSSAFNPFRPRCSLLHNILRRKMSVVASPKLRTGRLPRTNVLLDLCLYFVLVSDANRKLYITLQRVYYSICRSCRKNKKKRSILKNSVCAFSSSATHSHCLRPLQFPVPSGTYWMFLRRFENNSCQ